MLSDGEIKGAMEREDIAITPYFDSCLQPASYEVHLDKEIMVRGEKVVIPSVTYKEVADPWLLMPGKFVLASTHEWIALSKMIASRVEGKSSHGRKGLSVHCTAGFIDPGFRGNITLELYNQSDEPIALWAGTRIAQLCFFLTKGSERPYGSSGLGSKYQGQQGVTAARVSTSGEINGAG